MIQKLISIHFRTTWVHDTTLQKTLHHVWFVIFQFPAIRRKMEWSETSFTWTSQIVHTRSRFPPWRPWRNAKQKLNHSLYFSHKNLESFLNRFVNFIIEQMSVVNFFFSCPNLDKYRRFNCSNLFARVCFELRLWIPQYSRIQWPLEINNLEFFKILRIRFEIYL